MNSKEVSDIIREVAKERKISPTILERAWMNQFKVVKDVMQSATKGELDTFKTIYLRKLGKFVPNKSVIKYMTENAKRSKENKG
jgi:hypothetical protein